MHVSPVCVSHPKQSSVTVRSGAPEAAEPALPCVSAYMCRNTDAHKAQKTEKALIKFMKVKCIEQLL